MNDISLFFQSVAPIEPISGSLGDRIVYHTEGDFPLIEKNSIVIFYVPEFRNGKPQYHNKSDDGFRAALANYFDATNWSFTIYDLGNIIPGNTVEDTYFAVKQVVSELIKQGAIPVVIGGTQDLTVPIYLGYEHTEQLVNIMSVDNRFDLGDPEEPLKEDQFVNKLLMHRPCFLFNYSVLGIQAPLVRSEEMDLFENLHFDTIRLGEYVSDRKVAEPYLRNADILTMDLGAIRASEWQTRAYDEPNGFFHADVCQIARYAGISDKLSSFGIFNVIPDDFGKADHALVAQLIWYFVDGVANRMHDFPIGSKKDYTKFTVLVDGFEDQMIFYKSPRSDRWWMEVPYPSSSESKFTRQTIVPCSKSDYDKAVKGELPVLWWKTYKKLGLPS